MMKQLVIAFSFPLIGVMFWIYIQLVAITSKIVQKGDLIPKKMRQAGRPYILALWHNRQFFLSFVERYNGVHVLVSQSRDGEYISRIISWFGIHTIRGSSSKNGARALAQMIKTLKKGNVVAITPDGPRGPLGNVHPGVVLLAQKTGCPIIPLSYESYRKKVFSSWDRYEIPYPFNKIVVSYGDPIYLSPEEDLERAKKKVKTALDKNSAFGIEFLKKFVC